MIRLYRRPESPEGERVQNALRDLVVAHQVITVKPGEPSPVNGAPLPAIVDGDQVISGQEALATYLNELSELTERWRRYQSDVCYLDDDGNVC